MVLRVFIPQDPDGAVVGFQGIVEGQLVLAEAQVLSPPGGFVHLLRQPDQLLDDLQGFDGPVVVPPDGLLQHLGEGTSLDQVLPAPGLDLVIQQLAQEFHRQVLLGHTPHFGQKLIRKE